MTRFNIDIDQAGFWRWIMGDNMNPPSSHKSNSESDHHKQLSHNPPMYRNPFLNFLKDFRKKFVGRKMAAAEIAQRGGEAWRKLTDNEKSQYKMTTARRHKRHGSSGKSKKRRRRRRRKSHSH